MSEVLEIRTLEDCEIDAISGGPLSDAWGAIGNGAGTIAGSLALAGATGGLGTPFAFAGIAVGVGLIHVGVIQMLTEER